MAKKKKGAKRVLKAKRYMAIRRDAAIDKALGTIEKEYKLPKGSVRLVNPSGRQIRSDTTVDKLLKNWGY